jgi:flagellar basal-body rod protein FlgB
MRLFDQTFRTLERALDVRMARQGVLAGNLANVNTPGFTPRELDFAAAMGETGAAAPGGGLSTPVLVARSEPLAGELPLDLAGHAPTPLPGSRLRPDGTPSSFGNSTSAAPGLDGNAVDADRTLVALSENAIHYGAATKAIAKKFAILRYVASDGNA